MQLSASPHCGRIYRERVRARKTAFYDKVTLLIISLIGQYSFCDKAIGAFLISALPVPQVGLD
jgi:hypothetical protein